MQAESQVCRTKPAQIQPVPKLPQVPSSQEIQRELSEPWGFHCHYPRGSQASSAGRPALHTDTLAAQQIWQGCTGQSPGGVLSTPRTHCPSCRELWFLQTPRMELRRHGFLHTLHCADSSWMFSSCLEEKLVEFYFPTSHLTTKSILKAFRCLVPLVCHGKLTSLESSGNSCCPVTQAPQK